MKKLLLVACILFSQIFLVSAQSKEEDFAKAFFELVKKGDKKNLADKWMLKESDLELYNQSQSKLGNTKVMTKDEFSKFVKDKNDRILRNFDEMRAHAIKGKINFENSVYTSLKKVADANSDVPASYFKLLFTFQETFTIKILYEACPLGEELRLFNVQNAVTM